MVKKKVKKTRRKKFEEVKKPVNIFEQDINPEPFVKGAKAMGDVAVKASKSLAEVVFPSHEALVRRERKKLKDLKERIELLGLQKKMRMRLKELEEAED